MSRGHKHDPIYSLSINARFSVQFFFKKKIVMEKKKYGKAMRYTMMTTVSHLGDDPWLWS